MDPRERFSDTVDDYAAHRPDYPAALIGWIDARAPRDRVVDVGAGTGILSRQLAAVGLHVTAVEPNEAMRASGERTGGGPVFVDGQAERTGLGDSVADLVVGAQAFHWFDLDGALPELERVACAGGWIVAAWNVRLNEGFSADYDKVIGAFSSDFRTIPTPASIIADLRTRRPIAEVFELPHHQDLDWHGVHGRAWSSSYVVHGVADREGFDRALEKAYDAHVRQGSVRLDYRTRVVAWQTRSVTPSS